MVKPVSRQVIRRAVPIIRTVKIEKYILYPHVLETVSVRVFTRV
jgi:hypothetical protein